MLTYALGRGLDRADRRAVDQIVARLARNEYRFSALIFAVVESEPFLNPQVQRGSNESSRTIVTTDGFARSGRVRGLAISGSHAATTAAGRCRVTRRALRCAWPSSTSPTACTCQAGHRDRWARLRAAGDPRAARAGQGRPPCLEWPDLKPGTGPRRRRWRSRPRHGQLSDRPSPEEDRRRGPSRRRLGRPGGRPADRPCDPLPVAGDRLRGGQERRRVRPRLQLCLSVQPFVAQRNDAGRQADQSPPGLRSALR